jgi:hypothetical protein
MWQVIRQVARKVFGRQNEVEASPGSETVNNVKTQAGFLRTMVFLSQEGHYNPEDCNLNTHCCEIKSYILTSK